MKKIFTIILVAFTLSGFSQDTIDYVWKRQPIKFSKIAHADTIFLSGESPYGAYGSAFAIDSTADGRYFINDNANYNDSISILTNALADSVTLLRSDISDTADVIRAEFLAADQALRTVLKQNISDTATQIRSELSDSTFWSNAGGTYLNIEGSAYDRIHLGTNAAGASFSDNLRLKVEGQFNQNRLEIDPATVDSVPDASLGLTYYLINDGNISGATNIEVNSVITIYVGEALSGSLDPNAWTNAGFTLKVPSATTVNYDEFDVLKILYVGDGVFSLISHSENQ